MLWIPRCCTCRQTPEVGRMGYAKGNPSLSNLRIEVVVGVLLVSRTGGTIVRVKSNTAPIPAYTRFPNL